MNVNKIVLNLEKKIKIQNLNYKIKLNTDKIIRWFLEDKIQFKYGWNKYGLGINQNKINGSELIWNKWVDWIDLWDNNGIDLGEYQISWK